MTSINEKTLLIDLFDIPAARRILAEYNLPCLSCPMAAKEMAHLELGVVAAMYGLNLEKILQELNQVLGAGTQE